MNLKERLNTLSCNVDLKDYDTIVKELEIIAQRGENSERIYSDEITLDVIDKLKKEGLKVEIAKDINPQYITYWVEW